MEETNPYAALGASPPAEPPSRAEPAPTERPRFRIAAVLVGVLVGLGAFLAAIFAVVIGALIYGGEAALDGPDFAFVFVVMVPFTALSFGTGGFVTGHMARGWERRHAVVHVVISFALIGLLGAGMDGGSDTPTPPGTDAALNLAFFGSIFLGAELARRRRLRRQRAHGIRSRVA